MAKVAPLPYPPTEYNPRYFNELIRTLDLYFRQLQNPGTLVATDAQFLSLPTSSAGLPSGAIWVDTGAGNVLKQVP